MNDPLRQGLAKLHLDLTEQQITRLEVYAQCVLSFNEGYNLMKVESLEGFYINHVLDSLAACHALHELACEIQQRTGKSSLEVADVGSGGGCPAIPLAVAFPAHHFTLIERMEKRCVFLRDALGKVRVDNATVLCAKASEASKRMADLVVLRAFHPFDEKTTKLLLRLVRQGGGVAAYKARRDKIASEMQAVRHLVPSYQTLKLEVPFLEDHERHLVVIQKG